MASDLSPQIGATAVACMCAANSMPVIYVPLLIHNRDRDGAFAETFGIYLSEKEACHAAIEGLVKDGFIIYDYVMDMIHDGSLQREEDCPISQSEWDAMATGGNDELFRKYLRKKVNTAQQLVDMCEQFGDYLDGWEVRIDWGHIGGPFKGSLPVKIN